MNVPSIRNSDIVFREIELLEHKIEELKNFSQGTSIGFEAINSLYNELTASLRELRLEMMEMIKCTNHVFINCNEYTSVCCLCNTVETKIDNQNKEND